MKFDRKTWMITGLMSLIAMVILVIFGPRFFNPKASDGKHSESISLVSTIPPGLAPQYYPPAGFTWSELQFADAPSARYGVASPPAKPQADVLIIADSDFPAEAYFELANTLLSKGISVWIFELPGQGGAGRFKGQVEKIDAISFSESTQKTKQFISQIIRPTKEKPLLIIASGSGGLTALDLDTQNLAVKAFIIHQPNLEDPLMKRSKWQGEFKTRSYWGQIGQQWQIANPSLRLADKTQRWRDSASNKLDELRRTRLSKITQFVNASPTYITVNKDAPIDTQGMGQSLCNTRANCRYTTINSEQDLMGIIKTQLPSGV